MIKIVILLLTLQGIVMAIEEPKYSVIQTNDVYEVRVYEPYVVAQTTVEGDFDENGGKAFRKLFKYISGDNQQNTKISMTAPVIQESNEKNAEKIPMTAPVIQESDATDPNSSVYSFVMPLNSTIESLPIPLDKSIRFKEIPSKKVAVRVFSGFWSEGNYKENKSKLLNALSEANIKTIGEVSYARYNSPFSLWFMRRNEIVIEIE